MKSGLYLVGYGIAGCLSGCTQSALEAIKQADSVIFRWDEDEIFYETKELRQNVYSLKEFYEKHGISRNTYLAMFDEVRKHIEGGGSVAYITPGHPLVCELTAKLLMRYCKSHNIYVEVISGISFLCLVAEHANFDMTSGVQIISGYDLLDDNVKAAVTSNMHLIIASVRPIPVNGQNVSELDNMLEFLKMRYGNDSNIQFVVNEHYNENIKENIKYETKLSEFDKFRDLIFNRRVTYIIEGNRSDEDYFNSII